MSTATDHDGLRRTRDVRFRWLLSTPALVLVALGALVPIAVVFAYSFLTPGEYGDVVFKPSWAGWFNVAFEVDYFDNAISPATANLTILLRSVKLAIITTAVCAIVGFPTAYFIATRPRRSRPVWLFLMTIPFWTNLLIRTYAIQELLRTEGIINNTLIRLNLIETPIRFLFTETAVTAGMVYLFLPLMVLPLYSSLEKFDHRLVEASYDLYASRWQVLWNIILPLVRPGLIAGCLLVFIPSISSYVVPRLLGGGKAMMVGNLIELQFGQGRNWPLGSALSVTLVVLVVLVTCLAMRKADRAVEGGHG